MTTVAAACTADAGAIATIHLEARAEALPYLRRVHTDEETRQHFARIVAHEPGSWWVVRQEGGAAAYMHLRGTMLNDLYVLPRWQGSGFGSALLDRAKVLSPGGLSLWTFQRNARARAFYEARGFRPVRFTEDENEEREPDVLYAWRVTPPARP